VKSEHPDLSLTIATLVRSAAPVVALKPPVARFARWMLAVTALAFAGVIILGPRADAGTQMLNTWFLARASATLALMVTAGMLAFLMSVPAGEPLRLMRAVPLAMCLMWAAILVSTLPTGKSGLVLLLQVTPHPSCVLSIAVTALSPAFLMLRMLRRAVPLQATLTAGFGGLASLAAGALGAQFVCTNDAAAHHLLWHFTPVVLLTLAGAAAGSLLLRRR
jgi:hypothetical protein